MDTRQVKKQYRLQQWAQIICERNSSGLTIHAFCQERGISKNVYFYWLKQIREVACQSLPTSAGDSKFVPIEISAKPTTSSKLTLQVGEISLTIDEFTSESLLKNTLQTLRQVYSSC